MAFEPQTIALTQHPSDVMKKVLHENADALVNAVFYCYDANMLEQYGDACFAQATELFKHFRKVLDDMERTLGSRYTEFNCARYLAEKEEE